MKPIVFLLKFDKPTENKFRWVTEVNGINVGLYVPKWRTPKEVPTRVKLTVELGWKEGLKRYTDIEIKIKPSRAYEIIEENVKLNKEFTSTYCYVPKVNDKNAYFDFLHIPKNELGSAQARLNIKVEWIKEE